MNGKGYEGRCDKYKRWYTGRNGRKGYERVMRGMRGYDEEHERVRKRNGFSWNIRYLRDKNSMIYCSL